MYLYGLRKERCFVLKLRFLALFLVVCLLFGTTAALADEGASQDLPAWTSELIADGLALGTFSYDIGQTQNDTVSAEQLDYLTGIAADKLALLELPLASASDEGLVLDTTRGGVVNALYQVAAAYELEGIDQSPADFMVSIGVLQGDDTGLNLNRDCTVLEAAVMTTRLILAVYDMNNAGSLGLLWKATSAEGDVLYLLGSIHLDLANTYPFHKQLRDAIAASDELIFELDLNDTEQINNDLYAMQVYSDGTTLADHIEPGLYDAVVDIMQTYYVIDEATINMYKPWVLATNLQNITVIDDSTGVNNVAIDSYVNYAAVYSGKTIEAVETYAFQLGIFDSLSEEYQQKYLASNALALADVDSLTQAEKDAFTDILGEDALSDEYIEGLNSSLSSTTNLMISWKQRDAAKFDQLYGKDAVMESDDELDRKLFSERDPGMIKYADEYMSRPGVQHGMMVVGAGHMVGSTGIVEGLRALGYTVELVPNP